VRARKRGAFDGLVATAEQQERFLVPFCRWFYRRAISLHLCEDADLKQALAAVGLQPPSRKMLGGKLLDAEYERVKQLNDDKLSGESLLQLSTDGWRRRSAAGGKPLIDATVLLPRGGAVFHKVVSAAGETKDAAWTKDLIVELLTDITGGDLDRVLGAVMDNTSTNM
jgi:hypothetical protein